MRTPVATPPLLLGCDFTSAPRKAKPIVFAYGRLDDATNLLAVEAVRRMDNWAGFSATLATPGPWVGAFDLPFAMPRELNAHCGWSTTDWHAAVSSFLALPKPVLRAQLAGFCNSRPVGRKFAYRACDVAAKSSPSMRWVNPPVAWMCHAAVPHLLASGASMPQVAWPGTDASRVALEGYPALVARSVLGNASYKSDSQDTPPRRHARTALLAALREGRHAFDGIRVQLLDDAHASDMVADRGADALDAVMCCVQAAWAWRRRGSAYGAPCDAGCTSEGWIVGAGAALGAAAGDAAPQVKSFFHDK